ncbi:hypothetical protein L3Q82_009279 [Scortum barcoo]|uniref:Uncharacterized protein n=1 Tax=Scortum barcoo TaxID=214431 RepID=A0ACB8WG63_9TELE|nr:hypothetical protein L3Q82_009279 [Scortum barcoo]
MTPTSIAEREVWRKLPPLPLAAGQVPPLVAFALGAYQSSRGDAAGQGDRDGGRARAMAAGKHTRLHNKAK